MKKCLVLLLLFTMFACEKAKKTSIEKIEVKAANLDISSVVSVNCNDFETTFSKLYSTFSVDNRSTLDKLDTLIKNCKTSNDNVPLDVRRKIIVFYKDKSIDTLCIDRFNVCINNELVENNRELLNLLINLKK